MLKSVNLINFLVKFDKLISYVNGETITNIQLEKYG